MPRLPRCDRPGRWFHVYDRGIARRPVFETRADIRYFLSCLVRARRRGEIEIYAYCILTTHFHLLVRSPTGSLSVAMDRILNAYVRYYNRSRRRDGSLFRGRFGARPVDGPAARRIVLRYIDRNAVQAGLAAAPWEYPYGSAWHYVRARRPRWLETSWVDEQILALGHADAPAGYPSAFGARWTAGEQAVAEGRIRGPVTRLDPFDDLIDAAPPRIVAWLRRKTAVADGTDRVLPSADAGSVIAALEEERLRRPDWTCRTSSGQRRAAWPLVEALLLRDIAAQTWSDIGRRLEVGPSMAARRARQARTQLDQDPDFADRAGRLAREALDRAHGR